MDINFFPFQNASNIVDWLQIVCTLILAIIALWGERIRNWWLRPKLRIKFDIEDDSDCHLTYFSGQKIPCYYFRFKVINDGKSTAKCVEAYVEKYIDLGTNKEYYIFLNLRWSSTSGEAKFLPQLPSQTTRVCDLGYISTHDIFVLDTVTKPNSRNNEITIGDYDIILSVVAENAEPICEKFKISYHGGKLPLNQSNIASIVNIELIS